MWIVSALLWLLGTVAGGRGTGHRCLRAAGTDTPTAPGPPALIIIGLAEGMAGSD